MDKSEMNTRRVVLDEKKGCGERYDSLDMILAEQWDSHDSKASFFKRWIVPSFYSQA